MVLYFFHVVCILCGGHLPHSSSHLVAWHTQKDIFRCRTLADSHFSCHTFTIREPAIFLKHRLGPNGCTGAGSAAIYQHLFFPPNTRPGSFKICSSSHSSSSSSSQHCPAHTDTNQFPLPSSLRDLLILLRLQYTSRLFFLLRLKQQGPSSSPPKIITIITPTTRRRRRITTTRTELLLQPSLSQLPHQGGGREGRKISFVEQRRMIE